MELALVGCDSEGPYFKYKLSNTSGKYMTIQATSLRLDGAITTFKYDEPADIPPEGFIWGKPLAPATSPAIPCNEDRNTASVNVGVSVSYTVDGAQQTLNGEHEVSLAR